MAMVDPKKGAVFQRQVREIIKNYGRGGGRVWTMRHRWSAKPTPGAGQDAEIVVAEVVDRIDVPAASSPQATAPPRRKNPWWRFWKS